MEAAVEAAQEVRDERLDVVAPVAQRRQRDAHHVQPVEEILAERPLGHGPLEVPVGRRDDAHVHREGLGRSHRANLHLLEDAQQLHLQGGRELGDLVQEDRSFIGAAEQTQGIGHRAREGAAHVAEELGLQQVLRDRAAVDRDERPLGPRRQAMDGGGHQLLAGPALALDQHRRVRHRHLADDVLHLGHDLRGADELADRQLLAQARPERLDLAAQEAPLHHARHEVAQLVEDQRLRQVVVGAFLERLHGGGDRRIAGHHHDLDRLVLLADLAQEIEAAHVGHADVADEGVEEAVLEKLEAFGGGRCGGDLVPPLRQGFLEQEEDGLLVVHHQDLRRFQGKTDSSMTD